MNEKGVQSSHFLELRNQNFGQKVENPPQEDQHKSLYRKNTMKNKQVNTCKKK